MNNLITMRLSIPVRDMSATEDVKEVPITFRLMKGTSTCTATESQINREIQCNAMTFASRLSLEFRNSTIVPAAMAVA
ncbi:hypothetical protein J7J00_21550 [Bacillus sp. ISL-4]|uniref:hypothetical protein n=1 Tax=Bacillus sp. ISL-4 TaxID=2819125 RepID=UPI001BE81726|nr:hypothetical protein [Bacillus sp. ISL-4]MBT2668032.1 hypothetical protein [Bacillus sp. ISL-4]